MKRGFWGVRGSGKALFAFGVACLSVALLFVAADPTASGYEITVYDGYPFIFWLLVLVAMLLGQLVIFESADGGGRHRYWKWGLALVLATNVVLLLIPAIRYNLYARGDMFTHIGMIREIQNLGRVPDSNYYPNVHLFALTFSYVTGVAVPTVITLLAPVMTLVYLGSVYLLLDILFDDRKVLFVLPFTSLLLFKGQHATFQPSWYAFTAIPFALYVLFRSYARESRYRFKILLLVLVISLVFYHPTVTLFFIGMLIVLKAAFAVGRRVVGRSPSSGLTPIAAATIAFVLFFAWYYSSEGIIGSTLSVFYVLLGLAEGSSQFGNVLAVAQRTDPQLVDLALFGIHNYGLYAAVVSMGFVFFGYYAYLGLVGRRRYDAITAFLGGTLVLFTVGAAFAFFVDVVLRFHRILRYAIFAGPMLIGIGFSILSERIDAGSSVRYLRPILYASFFVFAFLAVFTLYGSPLSASENLQVTQEEVDGMEWLFDHRNTSLVIDQRGINQFRLYMYTYPQERLGTNVRWRVPPPPMHFSYATETSEDLPYTAAENRRYLVITELGRERNPRFYPKYRQYWRHTPEDFDRLETDPSFFHVYDDGSLDTYVVRGIGNQTNESRTA
jgi:hypothetical protein